MVTNCSWICPYLYILFDGLSFVIWISNSEYCISSFLIGLLNAGFQLIFWITLVATIVELKKGSKYPNVVDLMKIKKKIIPSALVGYAIGYGQPITYVHV